jgi:hypothetical protein
MIIENRFFRLEFIWWFRRKRKYAKVDSCLDGCLKDKAINTLLVSFLHNTPLYEVLKEIDEKEISQKDQHCQESLSAGATLCQTVRDR